jgi:hypothetical protein
MNIFDAVKSYLPQWKEVGVREFSDEEKAAIKECRVKQGKYDRSVMFFLKNGAYKYIALEKSSVTMYLDEMNPEDELDVSRMQIVAMNYVGTDPKYKGKQIFRIRYTEPKEEDTTVTSFDNPFGI